MSSNYRGNRRKRVDILRLEKAGALFSYVIEHKKCPKYFEPLLARLQLNGRGSLTSQISGEYCEQKKKRVNKCYSRNFLYSYKYNGPER